MSVNARRQICEEKEEKVKREERKLRTSLPRCASRQYGKQGGEISGGEEFPAESLLLL